MRTAFIETLCEVAARDDRLWLLCGDLGFSVLERFAERFSDRYINVGVAEQNMIGVAAGLALSGKTVFVYSIANFPVMRCLEQIRNDICYHRLNVKVVAVGGGASYGTAGYTHHAVEDLAVMRALPNMTVVAPADPVEARLATKAVAALNGPCYLRLGKAGEPVVHQQDPEFKLGKAILLSRGGDVTLVSTGGVLKATVEAAALLSDRGVHASVMSMPTIKPLDEQAVSEAATSTRLICVVEEHGDYGGLADAVARCLAATPRVHCRFIAINLAQSGADGTIGSQSYLNARAGLSGDGIARRVIDALSAGN